MTGFFEILVRRPRRTLYLAALAVVPLAAGVVRLELRTDGRALVPTEDPAVIYDGEVRDVFGIKDLIAVAITTHSSESIYNLATLALVQDLTVALQALVGVEDSDVVSLATERSARVRTGTLEFRTFLDPLPKTHAQLAKLRDEIANVLVLHGTLVSYDERSTAVLVGVDRTDDRDDIYEGIVDAVERFSDPLHTMRVIGAPVAESQLGHHLLADLALLVPLVLVVIAVLLFALTRSLWAVALGVVEVVATLASTFGVMGYAGVPVFLTTAILPVTLTAMATADEIHIFSRYLHTRETVPRGAAAGDVVTATMSEIYWPVVVTSLTTAIAFLSFLASPIGPIRAFGVFQAIGVVFAMAWSLTVTPAALTLLDGALLRKRVAAGAAATLGRRLRSVAAAAISARRPILIGAALLVASTPVGISRLYVQDGWISGFSEDSRFRRATSFVDEHFHGTHVLAVTVESIGEGDTLLDRPLLERVGALEAFLTTLPGVGGVLGPHSYVETMRYLMRGQRGGPRELPRDRGEARRILEYTKAVRGERRTTEVFDRSQRRGLLTVFLKDANFLDTRRILDATRSFAERELEPSAISVGFAGDVAVSQAMIPAIVRSQVSSIVLTLLGIWLVATVLLRSPVAGMFCLMPAALASACVLAVMRLLGVPLGVATSMFCAITLGIGVDYAVHVVVACRGLSRAGTDVPGAIAEAVMTSGRGITIDAVAIAGGFSLLGLSSVPANARLGLLVALSIAACYAISVVALPALLAAWRPRFLTRTRGRASDGDRRPR